MIPGMARSTVNRAEVGLKDGVGLPVSVLPQPPGDVNCHLLQSIDVVIGIIS